MKEYYRRAESYGRYLMDNKKRVSEIRKLCNSVKKYLGKRVLDVCCGGGILGFVLEKNGHSYTGLDINPDMIKGAKEYSKKIGSKNKFILGDANKSKIKGKFDTITMIGNSLGHINAHNFSKMIRNLPKAKYFIVDYRDAVQLFFDRKWKMKMKEKKGKTQILSVTTGMSTELGEIFKKSTVVGSKREIKFMHAIWAPFIIQPIMESNGWKLEKRAKVSTWQGYLDVYKRV